MAQDLFHFEKMVEDALRGVVRDALARVAREGLRGNHHFFIGFLTTVPGVVIPEHLRARYPEEMTIVLQHQFYDLEVGADAFALTLSFQKQLERLTVPFAAVRSFADPSVNFGLEFASAPAGSEPAAALPAPAAPSEKTAIAEAPASKVVALDNFRKR